MFTPISSSNTLHDSPPRLPMHTRRHLADTSHPSPPSVQYDHIMIPRCATSGSNPTPHSYISHFVFHLLPRPPLAPTLLQWLIVVFFVVVVFLLSLFPLYAGRIATLVAASAISKLQHPSLNCHVRRVRIATPAEYELPCWRGRPYSSLPSSHG